MPVELIDYGSHATETSHELLVLAFHKIGLAPTGSESTWFYIPDSVFDGYLKGLRDSTWQVIDAGTFVEGLSRPETLPPRSVLLTFDDGYCSMRHNVVPLLSAYRFPSVVFVPTSFVGDTNRFDRDVEPEEPICGWDCLLEIQRTGVSVQSHGVSHRHLSELGVDELRYELRESNSVLEARLGQAVTIFSFPYGDDGSDVEATAAELCQAGYRAAFLYGGGSERGPPASWYPPYRLAIVAATGLLP